MPEVGAELEIESDSTPMLQRRVSYEEVVHVQEEDDELEAPLNASSSLRQCLVVLTRWALSLQQINEDDASDSTSTAHSSCLCEKAEQIENQLKMLEILFDAIVAGEEINDDVKHVMFHLSSAMTKMQEALRAGVSIRLNRVDAEIRAKAAFLVGELGDVRRHVREACNAIVGHVKEILNVAVCNRSHQRHDDSEEISNAVAAMKTHDEDDDEDEDDFEEVAMDDDDDADEAHQERQSQLQLGKRKKTKTTTPPTSPTSSPTKRPRHGRTLSAPVVGNNEVMATQPSISPQEAIEMLENHRKGIRAHGLLKFVLWREALKAAEKEDNADVDVDPEHVQRRRVNRRLSSAI